MGDPELDGVVVFAPDGVMIGRIALPERCANLCFGGVKRNRLFMAASQSIYALYVNTQGRRADKSAGALSVNSALLFLCGSGLLDKRVVKRLLQRRGIGVKLAGIDERIGSALREPGALLRHLVHFRMRRSSTSTFMSFGVQMSSCNR